MPISSFPAAPVDWGMPAEFVALLGPVGLLGDPMDGEVELPEGMTIKLPDAVDDALLPDAVADAEVGMLVAAKEGKVSYYPQYICSYFLPAPYDVRHGAYVQTLTPALLQMSAKASRASCVESPQNFWIVFAASFSLHTAFRSEGPLYVFTAPRRQPGGEATANDARAKKAVVKMVRPSMVTEVSRGRLVGLEVGGGLGIKERRVKRVTKECGKERRQTIVSKMNQREAFKDAVRRGLGWLCPTISHAPCPFDAR
jgi:hypothetical protein